MTDLRKTLENIVQTRAGGAVQRCHGIRHNGSYSNAEHTWGVMNLLWHLYPEHFSVVAPYALSHDVPEFIWGDVPAPSMRYVPGLREKLGVLEDRLNEAYGMKAESELLTKDPHLFRVLKSCDRLDLWFWCQEQRLLGNMFPLECIMELERYFNTAAGLEDRAYKLWRSAKAQYVENQLVFAPRQAGVAQVFAEGE